MMRPAFFCVGSDVPADTLDLLRAACLAREVDLVAVDDGAFGGARGVARAPVPGDLVYLAGTDEASRDVARRLSRAGLVSLQSLDEPVTVVRAPALAAARVRMPRRVSPAPRDPDELAHRAAQLGAWPVLLRLPDGEGGRGVMRLDSLPSLVSVRDVLDDDVDLVEFVPHELAWRVVVIDDGVVAAEAWRPRAGDFRTNVGGERDPAAPRPPEVDRMAVAATHLLGLRFAGVDVMQQTDGSVCVAEVNSPCYFVQTQLHTGIDIAGRIVDALLARRRAG